MSRPLLRSSESRSLHAARSALACATAASTGSMGASVFPAARASAWQSRYCSTIFTQVSRLPCVGPTLGLALSSSPEQAELPRSKTHASETPVRENNECRGRAAREAMRPRIYERPLPAPSRPPRRSRSRRPRRHPRSLFAVHLRWRRLNFAPRTPPRVPFAPCHAMQCRASDAKGDCRGRIRQPKHESPRTGASGLTDRVMARHGKLARLYAIEARAPRHCRPATSANAPSRSSDLACHANQPALPPVFGPRPDAQLRVLRRRNRRGRHVGRHLRGRHRYRLLGRGVGRGLDRHLLHDGGNGDRRW